MPSRTLAVLLALSAALFLGAPASAQPAHASVSTLLSTNASIAPAVDSADKAVTRTTVPVWHVRVSGELRARAEAVSHYRLHAGAGFNDAYQTTRARTGVAVTSRYLDLEASGRHALSLDRGLVGGRRATDEDRWDLETAVATVRCCAIGAPSTAGLTLSLGRQPLAIGAERLVGVSDFSNARRTFDAARLTIRRRPVSLELLAARPVQVRADEPNLADSTTRLLGAVVTPGVGPLQLYLLDYRRQPVAGGDQRRTTAGARVRRAARLGTLGYDVEGAWQGGHADSLRVGAWFGVAELTALVTTRWSAAVTAGVDVASGDRDAADGVTQTFHVPFASAHSHGGAADVVGRPNTVSPRLAVTVTPLRRLQVKAVGYQFLRLTPADAVYGKDGSVLRAPGGDGRSIGAEGDLLATLRLGTSLRLLAGYSHVAPGALLTSGPVNARALDWGFFGTTLDF